MRLIHKNKLYSFDRPECEKEFLNGYLLDFSNNWSLINISHDDFFLNGYSIIKNDHIKRFRLIDDYNNFFDRALKKLGQVPKKPSNIDLKNIDSILQSVNIEYPIFNIHREILNNEICHIGSLQKVNLKTITLNLLDPGANYDGNFRINKSDITRIDFGGNYEKCLWLMASPETKEKIGKYTKKRDSRSSDPEQTDLTS